MIRIGTIANLEIRAHRTTFWGSLLFLSALLPIGRLGLNYLILETLVFAFAGLTVHLAGEFWHQIGHAVAARSTGYPMKGFTYYWVLAASIYPKNEPDLPAGVHIRRALGGPAASLLLSMALALILRFARIENTLAFSLLVFFFIDNLLIFTIGSLIPLGFNDGSTLLAWWSRRR